MTVGADCSKRIFPLEISRAVQNICYFVASGFNLAVTRLGLPRFTLNNTVCSDLKTYLNSYIFVIFDTTISKVVGRFVSLFV